MLSEENKKRLNSRVLYRKDPPRPMGEYTYWCKNWTFTVKEHRDGRVFMADTYWSSDSHNIEVTDDNIDEFTEVFNFDDVIEMRSDYRDEYEDEDTYCVSVDSGGMSYPKIFRKKGANRSQNKLIEKYEDEIKRLESSLEYKMESLARVKRGDI
jgi:hypothetical protein